MIHARNDYNRIQDPAGKIADDEPVFLLRAKDQFAPATVCHWCNLVRDTGDDALANHVMQHVKRMITWQDANGYKIPDAPADQLVVNTTLGVPAEGWQPIETIPEKGIFLVSLEKPMLGSKIHVMNRGRMTTIGSNFAFDCPKPTHWMPCPAPAQED